MRLRTSRMRGGESATVVGGSRWRFVLKEVVLLLLVVQSTSIVVLMRYSKTRPRSEDLGPAYLNTAAILMAEVLKLPVCLFMAAHTLGGVGPLRELLRTELFGTGKWDTLKCAAPAVAFTVQGNLILVALANLEAPTFQVSYQFKTLFTALFSVLILGRKLKQSQWFALLLLVAGTVLVSDPWGSAPMKPRGEVGESFMDGILSVLVAALLSSLSSVYFEMMLKKAPSSPAAAAASLWLRNIQLGIFAMPLAGIAMLLKDSAFLTSYDMLQGFDSVVWCIVLLDGIGGLLVAATMKYADNIAKCFAAALAIISGTVLSVPLFGFPLSPSFGIGASCTIIASIIYSLAPDRLACFGKPLPKPNEPAEEIELSTLDENSASATTDTQPFLRR